MYDTNQSAVTAALQNASTEVFTESTINSILSLVTSGTDTAIVVDQVTVADNGTVTAAAGTEIVFVTLSDTAPTNVTVNADIPVVLFQGAGGVNATFGSAAPAGAQAPAAAMVQGAAGDPIARAIVGTAGADEITILDDTATQVVAGDQDVVTAGGGHTVVVAAQGSSTVVGGGDTLVQATGDDEDYTVTAQQGRALIANAQTGVSVDISNVQFVQLDDNEALIFAANATQAAVANLYQALLARTADAGGLDYWFDVADQGQSLAEIAAGFMGSAEYAGGNQSDAEFLAGLYENVLGRQADTGGEAYWTNVLGGGAARAEVAAAFATAASNPLETTVVGTVTVVDGIVTS